MFPQMLQPPFTFPKRRQSTKLEYRASNKVAKVTRCCQIQVFKLLHRLFIRSEKHQMLTCRSRNSLAPCCVWNAPGSSRCRSPPGGRTTAGRTSARTPEALWICLAAEEESAGKQSVNSTAGKKVALHLWNRRLPTVPPRSQWNRWRDFNSTELKRVKTRGMDDTLKTFLIFQYLEDSFFRVKTWKTGWQSSFCSNEREWLCVQPRIVLSPTKACGLLDG